MNSKYLSALVYLFLAMLSIQYGASLAKGLFSVLGPAGVTVFRVGFAALILMVVQKFWQVRWGRAEWLQITFYGGSLGLMNLLFYLSLEKIPLGIAVALEFVGPLGLAFFSAQRRADWFWALLASLGIGLLLPVHQFAEPLDVEGVLFALGAGFFWALYIYFGQRVSRGSIRTHAAAGGMFVAALFVLPFGLLPISSAELHPGLLFSALGVAILSSAIPYSFEMKAMEHIPTKTFSILMSLEPVVAVLVGLIFLGEKLSVLQWVAIALIIAASVGTSAQQGKQE